jgi:aminopeptidase N
MEYPMATLLASSSLGGAFHEWMHSWYQGMLGTNESMYAWMDEGFTTYAEGRVSAYYFEQLLARHPDNAGLRDIVNQRRTQLPLIQPKAYEDYFNLVKEGMTEPLTTHADHFHTNATYQTASYSQGCIFMEQLGYIVGDSVRDKILLEYYREWRFKHPNANDFMRVAEKVSGMQLDWYQEYWINTTKTIDYAIDSLWEENGKSNIRLRMAGDMPMPLDVLLTFKDGSKLMAYIPQYFMFGAKPVEDHAIPRTQYEPWKWTNPTYTFSFDRRLLDVKIVEIDPTQRMADTDRRNNKLELKW